MKPKRPNIRYYFELEYDWDKIDFLLRKLKQAHPLVLADIEHFLQFLKAARDLQPT